MKRSPIKRKSAIKGSHKMPATASKRPSAALSGHRRPRTALPKTNPVRRAKERLRAYGPLARREWIASQPSILSGRGPCENVHVKCGGTSRKAGAKWIVPLTEAEHHELHQHGQKTFEAAHQIDLLHWAAVIDARWEQYVASQNSHPTPSSSRTSSSDAPKLETE